MVINIKEIFNNQIKLQELLEKYIIDYYLRQNIFDETI